MQIESTRQVASLSWKPSGGNLAELLVSVLGVGFGDEDISLRVLFQLPDATQKSPQLLT